MQHHKEYSFDHVLGIGMQEQVPGRFARVVEFRRRAKHIAVTIIVWQSSDRSVVSIQLRRYEAERKLFNWFEL